LFNFFFHFPAGIRSGPRLWRVPRRFRLSNFHCLCDAAQNQNSNWLSTLARISQREDSERRRRIAHETADIRRRIPL
jgi:hypothetical protein